MAAKFTFDGEELTVAEIRQRVPFVSDPTIRNHIAAGRNTSAAILNFDPAAAYSRNGRKAAKKTHPFRQFNKGRSK